MIKPLKEFLFKNTSARQTAIKNTFWLAAGQMGSRLFRAVIIIYAARVLGVAEYGVFAYVLGIAGFFTIFADMGINTVLTRETSRNPKEAPNYFATSLGIKVILLVLTGVIVIFAAPYISNIEIAKNLILLAALLIIVDGLRDFSSAFFRGKEKMELEALLTITSNVAIVLFGFLILQFFVTAEALVAAYIISAGAGTVLGIIILRNYYTNFLRFFKKNLLRPIISSALPIAFLSVLGAFMLNVDILMIGFFKSSSDVGLYSASQKIIQVLYLVPAIIASALFPIFSRLAKNNNHSAIKRIMERGMAAVYLVAIPLTVGGVLVGKNIIDLLYGSEYIQSALTFQILIITPLLVFPGILVSNYLLAYNKQKKLAPYAAMGAIGNVILNILLIPPFGIAGSAVATIGANLIYNTSAWRLAKKTNNFSTFKNLKKITAATLVMGVIVYTLNALGLHVLAVISISALVYLGILLLWKESTLTEVKSILFDRGENQN